jgi:hypothetical protein
MEFKAQLKYGQLFWWRESDEIHTLITILGNPLSLWSGNLGDTDTIERFLLTFRLFNSDGVLQTTWQQTLTTLECIFLDSAYCSATQGLKITEGVLVLSITTQSETPVEVKVNPLYSITDWYSESGEIVSLHSDQLIEPNQKPVEWTEIVIQETPTAQNSLVILNGAEKQPSHCISLELKNYLNETCEAIFNPEIQPFSLCHLRLATLFPNILDFCKNQPITVKGRFTSHNVFIRPYVVTEGKYLSIYHGGDRYFWRNLPAFAYKFMGRGEVNPMLAIQEDSLSTKINLLNTHGELEQDFWVDADLYDCDGNLVTTKDRWLLARRNQLCEAEISDLLPTGTKFFVGHVALRFSREEDQVEYPRRLQALMEYRTSQSTARVMAWSDTWNWQEVSSTIDYLAYYRVWWRSPFVSYVSLTNCSINQNYQEVATYRLRLEKGDGDYLVYEGTIAPQGTMYKSISEIFPNIAEFLGDQPVGLVVVETTFDLASMHLTKHQKSGVCAAEHFLPLPTCYDGEIYRPCGS